MERKSAGLRVRRMTEADLEPLHRLLSDPEVMRYLEPPFSREQTRAFLDRAGLTPEPLILAVDDDGGFAGYVIWHPYDDVSMELGWVLDRSRWGRGYAGELTRLLTDVLIKVLTGDAKKVHPVLYVLCIPLVLYFIV